MGQKDLEGDYRSMAEGGRMKIGLDEEINRRQIHYT